jgi:ABC-type molybdate transport system ATPase subunit
MDICLYIQHQLLGVVLDLGVRREHATHDPDHVRNRHQTVLLPHYRCCLHWRRVRVSVAAADGMLVTRSPFSIAT